MVTLNTKIQHDKNMGYDITQRLGGILQLKLFESISCIAKVTPCDFSGSIKQTRSKCMCVYVYTVCILYVYILYFLNHCKLKLNVT